jgi:hypothetical protein
MSKILDTANGTTTLNMYYDIELEYLFDDQELDDTKRQIYEEVQAFVAKHGETLSVDIEASIDGGEACFEGILEITSEKTRQTIDHSTVPKFLIKQIESNAEDYAEENGLETFLW